MPDLEPAPVPADPAPGGRFAPPGGLAPTPDGRIEDAGVCEEPVDLGVDDGIDATDLGTDDDLSSPTVFPNWAVPADGPERRGGQPVTPLDNPASPATFPRWARWQDAEPTGPAAPPLSPAYAGRPPVDPAVRSLPDPRVLAAAPAAAAGTRGRGRPSPVQLAAVAIVVVMIGAGAALFVRGRSSTGEIAPDIVGSCFVYDAGRGHVDHVVGCDEPHDGKVLATTASSSACPAGTDAVLTTADDPSGAGGVLCVQEH